MDIDPFHLPELTYFVGVNAGVSNIAGFQGSMDCSWSAEHLDNILFKIGGFNILAQIIFGVSLKDILVISHPLHELIWSEVSGIGQIIELGSLGEGFNVTFVFSGNVFGVGGQSAHVIDEFRVNRLASYGKGGLINYFRSDRHRFVVHLFLPIAFVGIIEPVGEHQVLHGIYIVFGGNLRPIAPPQIIPDSYRINQTVLTCLNISSCAAKLDFPLIIIGSQGIQSVPGIAQ